MSSTESTFSLSDIGDELDRAREARNGVNRGRGGVRRMSGLEVVSETEPIETSEMSETSSVTRPASLDRIEQGGSVCICCLARPPSAVLLPCTFPYTLPLTYRKAIKRNTGTGTAGLTN